MSEFHGKSRDALIQEIVALRRLLTEAREDSQYRREADELRRAKRAVEAAALAKTRFLANMSHELRTPMTAILGAAQLLIDEDGDEASAEIRRDLLHTLQRNGHHLVRILGDVLDLSKIEAGKLAIERIPTRLPELLKDVEVTMRPNAHNKGLGLDIAYATPVPAQLETDPTRLRQILMNLIGNAVKFTERGGVRVLVGAYEEPEGAFVRMSVLDTGSGIGPNALEEIFEPFSQADASTTRRHGGTGLGLPISRELARLLGGDLTADSIEGRGSSFHLTLGMGTPLAAHDLVEPDGEDANALVLPEDDVSTNTAIDTLRVQAVGSRILLVEDGPDNRKLIALMLNKAGFDVTLAENGELGLIAVREAGEKGEPFDLVLMDMQMPVMDGYTATRALRAEGCTLPVVALTAHAVRGERERCLQVGCDDFATKPICRQDLIETVYRNLTS